MGFSAHSLILVFEDKWCKYKPRSPAALRADDLMEISMTHTSITDATIACRFRKLYTLHHYLQHTRVYNVSICIIKYSADILLILLPNEFPRFTSENGACASQYVFTNASVRKKFYPPNKHQLYLPMSFVVFFTSFAVKIGKKKCGATTYLSW